MARRVPSGVRLAATARARLALADAPRPLDLARPAVARDVAFRLARTTPGSTVLAGDVLALGLLDEVLRIVIARYLDDVDGAAFDRALESVRATVGERPASATLGAHATAFPPPPPGAGNALRELLLTNLAATNPAIGTLQPLVDDTPLVVAPDARYGAVLTAIRRHFAAGPRFGPDGQDLVTLLEAPARASPASLAGQLIFVRDRWSDLLGAEGGGLLERLLIGLGVIAEEATGLGRWGAGPPGPALGGLGALGGDAGTALADAEPERFSSDVAWMPELVLVAKSTNVWLDQLSRSRGRPIRSLDQIPDDELERLARLGVTGLWLIGLWERSRASQEIKRRRGNPEALASAYALDDYAIAAEFGGEAALAGLRANAWRYGIRLASDMVPNHMGIDSRWVIEHPEWFVQVPDPPYPSYTFNGPDLSSDGRVAIVLEDHYWDDSDAAVVFKRADRWSGEERYLYHGNDGTSMPWNDTAQLDYLRADVREAVIQTILHVARQFPVIRFDAAMVLAKRHIERLWHPLPGASGAIPSRAEHAMTKREFDAAIPTEFWREVVDRVAAEAPGTLLLAEAFWLMEGYFVRTLGMHRVYNSAFMVLLREEDNATYRRVMRDTLEFDPQILGRFVNFMTNPDEKPASEQFGTGDKHFAVATLMATLPGLPMLGHGQFEGFRERYGHEFSKAGWDEPVDDGLLARYEREIVPLLRRRGWFAGSRDFLLYDAVGDDGAVREDVLAYSNVGPGGERSLVVVHNRYASTSGRIRESVGFAAADPTTGERSLRRRTLGAGLGLERNASHGSFACAREAHTGLEYLWPADGLVHEGLWLELGPYDYRVYLDWRVVADGAGERWGRLAGTLGGRGVPSLDDALRDLDLAPVHEALAAVLAADGAAARGSAAGRLIAAVRDATGARGGATDAAVAEAIAGGLAAVDALGAVDMQVAGAGPTQGAAPAAVSKPRVRTRRPAVVSPAETVADRTTRAALRARTIVAALGGLGDSADVRATASAWFVDLRLGPAIERILGAAAVADPPEAVHRTWLLLRLPSSIVPTSTGRSARTSKAARGVVPAAPDGRRAVAAADGVTIASGWLADGDLRTFLGVHEAGGITWLRAEPLATLAAWTLALCAIEGSPKAALAVTLDGVVGAAVTAGYAVNGWLSALGGPARGPATTRPASARPAKAPSGEAPSADGPAAVTRRASPRGRRGASGPR
ncbi:MAG TPA: alpha-amylase family glycosyl hydrolase [Candidatus Limnocylindrales bacterium]